jgi:hypothetical protein
VGIRENGTGGSFLQKRRAEQIAYQFGAPVWMRLWLRLWLRHAACGCEWLFRNDKGHRGGGLSL